MSFITSSPSLPPLSVLVLIFHHPEHFSHRRVFTFPPFVFPFHCFLLQQPLRQISHFTVFTLPCLIKKNDTGKTDLKRRDANKRERLLANYQIFLFSILRKLQKREFKTDCVSLITRHTICLTLCTVLWSTAISQNCAVYWIQHTQSGCNSLLCM